MDIRRLHVKRWVSGLLIPLLSTVANAQEPSEQDLLLMAAAQKAVATYRDSGVAGMGRAVDECDGLLSRASAEEDVEYCVALNLASMQVDAITSAANQAPRTNRFKDEMVGASAEELLKFFNVSAALGDLGSYLNEQNARVHRFVLMAINAPGTTNNSSAINNSNSANPLNEAAAKAFTQFWTSTDCEQLQELSQWPQLVEKLQTNDDQLCRTFIEMHERVAHVDVVGTQALADGRVRVSANLALDPQGEMKQEDNFVMVNGRWVLSARPPSHTPGKQAK